jgi:hypothetical protein
MTGRTPDDGVIQFPQQADQQMAWASSTKQQNLQARAFIVLLDVSNDQDRADLKLLMRAFERADLHIPVIAVNFASASPNIIRERQRQVWETMSCGVANFLKQVDADLFDSVECSVMRSNVQTNQENRRLNQLGNELEEARNQIDYMMWQWIPSQLRLSIPAIQMELHEQPDGSVDELQFLRALGRGNFGMVHEARAPNGQTLAVKVLRKDNAPTIHEAERIYREIQILESIPHHPHLAQLHFLLHSIDTVYLCLAYGGPRNLYQMQVRQPSRKFTYDVCRQIFSQIAGAIGHMHQNTVYHRDIKPENIAVTGDIGGSNGISCMVVDFGLAVNSTRPLRQLCGSLPFAAPEILDVPCRYHGGPVDAFAVGMLLFELVRGQSAMENVLGWNNQTRPSPQRAQQLRSVLANGPPSIGKQENEPHAVTTLFTDLLQIDPSRRSNLVEALRSPWLTSAATEQHVSNLS